MRILSQRLFLVAFALACGACSLNWNSVTVDGAVDANEAATDGALVDASDAADRIDAVDHEDVPTDRVDVLDAIDIADQVDARDAAPDVAPDAPDAPDAIDANVDGSDVSDADATDAMEAFEPDALDAVDVPDAVGADATDVSDAFDADTSDAPSCPDGAPQLVAIEPSVATTGDTLTLEGAFCGPVTVTFPGGATASAALLGNHRATVVVPASATAGDLSVTVNGLPSAPVSFRRTSFALGLQTFQQFDDQTNGPRQMPSLVTARDYHATATVGHFVYVMGGFPQSGGALTSVESARIYADGALGPFGTVSGVTLAVPRGMVQNAAVVIGGFVYVVGGSSTGADALSSIERATINADGTLGTFAVVPGVHLVDGRYNHTVTVVGNSVVVIGGTDTINFLDSVEAAPIQADGSLGAFATIGHLQTPREAHAAAVVGGSLYVLGGDATPGGIPAIASIESAPIAGDGTLGMFVNAGQLAMTRQSALVWRLGSMLFVGGGGGDSAAPSSVESASIDSTGTLGAFTTLSAAALPIPVQGASAFVAGNYAYAIGGTAGVAVQRAQINSSGLLDTTVVNSSALGGGITYWAYGAVINDQFYAVSGGAAAGNLPIVQQATIGPEGDLGAFTTSTSTLGEGIARHTVAVIGNQVYTLAGFTGGNGTQTAHVEQATIQPDGTLGAFTIQTNSLVMARGSHVTAVAGNYVYVFGGFYGLTTSTSVEVATINADGSLGPFTLSSHSLTTSHTQFSTAILGNYLYALGGDTYCDCGGPTIVERAPLNSDGSLAGDFVQTYNFVNDRPGARITVIGPYLYAIAGDGGGTVERAVINPDGTIQQFNVVPGLSFVSITRPFVGFTAGNAAFGCTVTDGGSGLGTGPETCFQMSLM